MNFTLFCPEYFVFLEVFLNFVSWKQYDPLEYCFQALGEICAVLG